jgi:hypothetical protein
VAQVVGFRRWVPNLGPAALEVVDEEESPVAEKTASAGAVSFAFRARRTQLARR